VLEVRREDILRDDVVEDATDEIDAADGAAEGGVGGP
jgi:hypothetical protein